ncbi:MAG: O-antigen ligase family protein [Schwartzia sp.]|nr:O-antigen ligase family protein [Schwartzia sp. (in: firmicutes)]
MDVDNAAWRKKRNLLSLAQINFYALLATAFFIALSPTAAVVTLLIGVVLWLVRWRIDPEVRFRRLPLDRPLFLFALIGAASILVSPDRFFSFYNYINLVGVYLLTYLLTGQLVREEEQLRQVVEALALSAILVVAYGFYQYIFGIDISDMKWVDGNAFPELRKRVFSTWENPNILAGYLDEAIALTFAFFMNARERMTRFLLGGGLLALAACLAMTYARGACLAVAVVLALYGVLRDRRVLLGCLVVGGGALFLDPLLAERLASAFTTADTSAEMRLALWESTLDMIFDHPLLGIGWGAYWMVYPTYDFYINDPAVKIVHAHNVYLNYAAEIGVFGALTWCAAFFGAMASSLRTGLTSAPSFLASFRLGLGLALATVALGGLTDDVLFNIPTSMLLWMLFALSAALPGPSESENDVGTKP